MFRETVRDEEIKRSRGPEDAAAAARADRASRLLVRVIAALLILLFLSQALLLNPAVRKRISPVDREEGRPIFFAPVPEHVLY